MRLRISNFLSSACQLLKMRSVLVPAVGAGLGIAVMIGLADVGGLQVGAVPFITSIVLVMASPNAPQAQPRNLIGGHIICAIVGFAMLRFFGGGLWLAPVAIALSVVVMQITNTMHPPAGISPFLIVTLKPSWIFLLIPVTAGAVALAAFAYLYHRLTSPGVWPQGGPNRIRERGAATMDAINSNNPSDRQYPGNYEQR